MRIEPPDNQINDKKKAGKVKRKGKRTDSSEPYEQEWTGFIDVLGNIQLDQAEEEAKRSLQEVLKAGNRFSRSPTNRNFQSYRDSIKRFLRYIEKGLYRIREDVGVSADFPKLYMVADIVDEKMHQIASLLMKNEKNTLQFAGKVEEINGLILDLYR
ncbi:MAG TPA: YaaR family protein [Thermotogota bacterium]|jgi:hypothetical protein|nr:YaaR family protein [Thermotogota bacterium]NLH18790.1 YaaR family protein [Thermotogaceae bacterium]OQC30717.1 MAG: hypothetical protein BWX67_01617 [Thermotogota bacterium ADurb.Bin062]HNW46999.1 YaaR family protein [Thermotogota bacterium]HNY82925.1 YaaR family protein [Thermotogota bacterium]